MRDSLGKRGRDKLTGFEGTIVSRSEWVYGCVQLALKSNELYEGKPVESQWFDEPQVEILETKSEQLSKDRLTTEAESSDDYTKRLRIIGGPDRSYNSPE